MSLNVRTEPLENRQLSLFVEVEQERVDQELRKAARKLSGEMRLPGFRRGKAPYPIVLQYVGLQGLYNEFLDDLAGEVYKQAIEQAAIEPYAMASLDISTLEPLVYVFEVPLEPTVDLGDYRSLRIEEEEPEVTDEEIDERLQAQRTKFAGWTEVERPSEYGDMLTIDVKSVVVPNEESAEDADGSEEIVVLDETDWDVTLDEENPMEPAGLDEQLVGMSPGEEKEFDLTWPEESQSIYAGKTAHFFVTLHQIQANLEPELDDEFAQMIGPDFETLDDLRDSIRQSILDEKKRQADNEYLESALDALVEQSVMDYPPVVVEDQIDAMTSEFARQLRSYGIENLDTYLSQTGQSREEYRDSLREQAEITARRNLAISELYQKEGITVTDAEVEERIQAMTEGLGESNAEMAVELGNSMRAGPGRPVLESQIIQEKSLRRLLAIVRGEELPEPGAPESADEGADESDRAAGAEPAAEIAAETSDEVVAEVAGAAATDEVETVETAVEVVEDSDAAIAAKKDDAEEGDAEEGDAEQK